MRLLLDEPFSYLIAHALRADGYDVQAVHEIHLSGTSDDALLGIAYDQGRVLVTNNVQDFVPLEREWAAAGAIHHGIIYTDDASVSRAVNQMGHLLTRLRRAMETHPGDDALRGRSIFLAG